MKVLKHGKEALKCPECESREIMEITHLTGWFDAFINLMSGGLSHQALKCMCCKCVFRPEDCKI